MAKLLIVDDNEQILQILSRYAQAQGHQAVLARTGPQALEAFTAQEPDLVLLDVMLPGMDGFAVCREIRARSLTPVIMITARSDDEDRILGLDTGADDYVVKPFFPRRGDGPGAGCAAAGGAAGPAGCIPVRRAGN